MSWYEKSHQTSFETDDNPIHGLYFLDGNIISLMTGYFFVEGEKFPMIEFPSGHECQVWETGNQDVQGIVHLFGECDLAYRSSRDEAYQEAQYIAEQIGYIVRPVDDDGLEVIGFDDDDHFLIRYDNDDRRMIDVIPLKESSSEKPKHPGHILMNEDIQASLPPLYSQEDNGWDAIAPVKYFHVNGWYWYATEQSHGVFFGLVVSPYVSELGYFHLSELESIGEDGSTIPVERDLHYHPQSLKAIKAHHQRMRGERTDDES